MAKTINKSYTVDLSEQVHYMCDHCSKDLYCVDCEKEEIIAELEIQEKVSLQIFETKLLQMTDKNLSKEFQNLLQKLHPIDIQVLFE